MTEGEGLMSTTAVYQQGAVQGLCLHIFGFWSVIFSGSDMCCPLKMTLMCPARVEVSLHVMPSVAADDHVAVWQSGSAVDNCGC